MMGRSDDLPLFFKIAGAYDSFERRIILRTLSHAVKRRPMISFEPSTLCQNNRHGRIEQPARNRSWIMKKTGVLNRELAGLIAGLGHTDCVMICDAGFPIPEGKKYVDLALCAGIPSFMDCLRVILSEAIFDEITIAEEMNAYNPEYYGAIQDLFKAHRKNIIPQTEFLVKANDAKFIIRTGELKPYSNILLYSASGVERFYHDYVL